MSCTVVAVVVVLVVLESSILAVWMLRVSEREKLGSLSCFILGVGVLACENRSSVQLRHEEHMEFCVGERFVFASHGTRSLAHTLLPCS